MNQLTPYELKMLARQRKSLYIPTPVKWIAIGGVVYIGWKVAMGLVLPLAIVGGAGFIGWKIIQPYLKKEEE